MYQGQLPACLKKESRKMEPPLQLHSRKGRAPEKEGESFLLLVYYSPNGNSSRPGQSKARRLKCRQGLPCRCRAQTPAPSRVASPSTLGSWIRNGIAGTCSTHPVQCFQILCKQKPSCEHPPCGKRPGHSTCHRCAFHSKCFILCSFLHNAVLEGKGSHSPDRIEGEKGT